MENVTTWALLLLLLLLLLLCIIIIVNNDLVIHKQVKTRKYNEVAETSGDYIACFYLSIIIIIIIIIITITIITFPLNCDQFSAMF